MMQAAICSKKRYKKKQNLFFEDQQSVNQEKNIPSNNDEPMDVDTTSQRLQLWKATIFVFLF